MIKCNPLFSVYFAADFAELVTSQAIEVADLETGGQCDSALRQKVVENGGFKRTAAEAQFQDVHKSSAWLHFTDLIQIHSNIYSLGFCRLCSDTRWHTEGDSA